MVLKQYSCDFVLVSLSHLNNNQIHTCNHYKWRKGEFAASGGLKKIAVLHCFSTTSREDVSCTKVEWVVLGYTQDLDKPWIRLTQPYWFFKVLVLTLIENQAPTVFLTHFIICFHSCIFGVSVWFICSLFPSAWWKCQRQRDREENREKILYMSTHCVLVMDCKMLLCAADYSVNFSKVFRLLKPEVASIFSLKYFATKLGLVLWLVDVAASKLQLKQEFRPKLRFRKPLFGRCSLRCLSFYWWCTLLPRPFLAFSHPPVFAAIHNLRKLACLE